MTFLKIGSNEIRALYVHLIGGKLVRTRTFVEFVRLGDVSFAEADALTDFWPRFRLWVRLG